eukprot:187769-Hanusia_phi.AAC.1
MIRDHRFRLHGVRVRSVLYSLRPSTCRDHSVSLNLSVSEAYSCCAHNLLQFCYCSEGKEEEEEELEGERPRTESSEKEGVEPQTGCGRREDGAGPKRPFRSYTLGVQGCVTPVRSLPGPRPTAPGRAPA